MGYKKSVFHSLALVSQLGICVLTPVLFCVFAGSYVDSRYGTRVTLILLILGTLGGGRGAYLMAKRALRREEEEEKRLQKEQMKKVLQDAGTSAVRPKRVSRVRGTGVLSEEERQ